MNKRLILMVYENILMRYFSILFLLIIPFMLHAEQAKAQRLFEQNLCLQVKFYQGQPLEDLTLLKRLQVKWVREEDNWAHIERVAGQYQALSDSLQKRLAYYKAHDIGVIFIVSNENPVAYPNSPAQPANFVNVQGYANYAAYLTRALKASGVKFKLELGNEPHNRDFAKKEYLGGRWHGGPPSPWLDHYVEMVHAAVKAVKAVDSTVEVMVNDDMWIIHYFFLDKGLPEALDGLSVHPYTGGRVPEVAAVTADAQWTKPYQVVDQDQSFESAVRRLKQHWRGKLGTEPKLWITEWGWRVGELAPDGSVVDAQTIADYLPRAFILAEQAGMESTCWFSAQDVVDGPMGLKTNEGQFRPAFDAYVEMSHHLAKSKLVCEAVPASKDKRAFLFKKADAWLLTTWFTAKDAEDKKVRYQVIKSKNQIPKCLN